MIVNHNSLHLDDIFISSGVLKILYTMRIIHRTKNSLLNLNLVIKI